MTIAGSDPSGGAGLQADLKTFHQHGVYGEAVVTLLTVQNTRRVSRVELVSAELVAEQLRAVMDDVPPHAAKTGALGDEPVIRAVAEAAAGFTFPLVVDPVMISKHGAPLMAEAARGALVRLLLPKAKVVTPNLHEASALTGLRVESVEEMREAARRLAGESGAAVVVKGGHLAAGPRDVLLVDGVFHEFESERFDTPHTHGTGCTFSAAIAANLALGRDVVGAVARAKRFIAEAIRTAPGIGGGQGPVNHFASVSE